MAKREETFQDRLFKEFRYLYRGRQMSFRQNLMGFGFECGAGWEHILRMLSLSIMSEIKRADKIWWLRPYLNVFENAWNNLMKLQPQWFQVNSVFGKYPRFQFSIFPGFLVEQVKEKYGTLRFYMAGETDKMSHYISIAERASEQTCEQCGSHGKMRGKGWAYAACSDHCKDVDKDVDSDETF